MFEGGVRDLPQEAFWSCEPETKRGDLVLVYRRSMNHLSVNHLVSEFGMPENVAKRVKNAGIGKDFPVIWEATSDAKRKPLWHWPHGCDAKEIQRIDPPLQLQELKSEPRLRKWEGLRWNFQARGCVALKIPKFAWNLITNMIEDTRSRQSLIQQETSNSTKPRSRHMDRKPHATDTKLATTVKEKTEDRQRRERLLPVNAGKPWNHDEEKLLCEGFDGGLTVSELAQKHQRTEGAIQSRLEKLSKVPSRFRSEPSP